MLYKGKYVKGLVASTVLASVLVSGLPARGQELIPVGDVTGGSSVFVFRGGAKPAPRRFVSRARATTTKLQRIETAKRVNTQYKTLAKVDPRRVRSTVVTPDDPRLPKIPTMPKEEASKIFAGVGDYYMDRDDFNRAIEFFRESSQLDSKNNSASSGLSEALALKGNEVLVKDGGTAARPFFEEALKYNPRNSPAYFGLAEVFSDLDDEMSAINNYELALSNDQALTEIYVPLGILYYQQGNIAKSESLLKKALALPGGENDAQLQYFLGLIKYAQQNDNQGALTAFQKAYTLDPANAEAYHYAGETLSRMDQYPNAVTAYKKATELKPNYFEAWLGLGSAYYEQDNYTEAVTAYKQATRLKNNSIEAYTNLGDAQRAASDFNGSEASYNLATTFIERDPSFSKDEAADIYSKIGFVIAKQCEINIRQAIPCRWEGSVRALEKAAAITNNNVDTANLGWAYYNAAKNDIVAKRPEQARIKLEKAKENLQKAAFSSPKFIEGPLLNLGMTLTDLGDYNGAVDALTRVVNKQPKWVFAINELGIAYRKQDKYKEASDQFRRATQRDGKYAVAYYNLAESEFRGGNLPEAKKAYDQVKKLGRRDLAAQLELISGGQLRG
jgi:tetratricopeptide (TPR) repeat protein